MFYTVYKITNRINGKIYIGCHKTDNLEDGYMGSGKLIKRAIKKYGLENFTKEYIKCFDNAEDMFAYEKETVFIGEASYNLKNGGHGGFDHIKINGMKGKKQSQKQRNTAKQLMENLNKAGLNGGKIAAVKHPELRYNFLGKRHNEETKRRIGVANSLMTGQRNSQYGSCWITNGTENRKLRSDDILPEGWVKGRR